MARPRRDGRPRVVYFAPDNFDLLADTHKLGRDGRAVLRHYVLYGEWQTQTWKGTITTVAEREFITRRRVVSANEELIEAGAVGMKTEFGQHRQALVLIFWWCLLVDPEHCESRCGARFSQS